MRQYTEEWFEKNQEELAAVAEEIFGYAEVAEEEYESQKCLGKYMEKHGFSVEYGVGGMPTSLRAQWGEEGPCIGFLGEYDALPGLNQGPEPVYNGNSELPGHGCGHNLLGTGAAAAAVALRDMLKKENRPGKVVFYGCPAEETLKGKVVMVENGCFKELDAAISFHPSDTMNAGNISYSAMDSILFTFNGISAHAAACPHTGRSALDAVELMDIAANYMREHVTDNVRIHYAPIDCGMKPNIVPAKAEVWYYVRARSKAEVEGVTEWLLDIARGAALMTGTKVSWEFLTRGNSTLVNDTITRMIYEEMCQLKKPEYTEEEMAFAAKIAESAGAGVSNGKLDLTVPEPIGIEYQCGSTDVSDVTHVVPTGNFKVVTQPLGIPLHTWLASACSASSIGRKGMIYAGKVMAMAGWRLATDADLRERAKKEFEEKNI